MNFIKFTFQDPDLKSSDLGLLIGFNKDPIPEPINELIEEALYQASLVCAPCCGYKIFSSISVDAKQGVISLENQQFSVGTVIADKLDCAEKIALVIASAGDGISKLSKKKEEEGDTLFAYILDLIGTLIVEKTVTLLQQIICNEISDAESGITGLLSPGSCGWDIASQKELFTLIPHGACNVTLSDSSFMYPIKSISGILGIGPLCANSEHQCDRCPDKQCIYGIIKRGKKTK